MPWRIELISIVLRSRGRTGGNPCAGPFHGERRSKRRWRWLRSLDVEEPMTPFVWPLSASTIADEMNTSYGPRIDADRWDFHDGIDLPARVGTAVHAITDGVVHRAGPADKTDEDHGFGSTHVVLRVDGQNDLFIVYLHLDSIAEGVIPGAHVSQGDVIAMVGHEDAEYPHLHFEFRKGGTQEHRSVHPLHYLPYTNTSNVGGLRLDRCNF